MIPVDLSIDFSEEELAMRAPNHVVISKLRDKYAGCQVTAAILAHTA